jgi:hypothetical protein
MYMILNGLKCTQMKYYTTFFCLVSRATNYFCKFQKGVNSQVLIQARGKTLHSEIRKNLIILFGINKNLSTSGMYVLLCPLNRRAMKMAVVIIQEYIYH